MKSKNYIFLLLLILIPLVNASILTVENENPQPHETIIGILSSSGGIDTTLTKSDLKFYKDGIQKTPQEYNIYFYNESYYFYFIFSIEGNYTIFIDNVNYKTESGNINSEDINKTLEIKKNNESSTLQIKPGVVYGYNDFTLDLINKGESDLTIKTEQEEFVISPSDSKLIQLGEKERLSFFTIETYKTFTIPIISLSTPTNIGEKNNESEKADFLINDGKNLEYAVEQGKREDYSFSIESLSNENITDLEFTSDIDGLTILTSPDELASGSVEELNIKIKISDTGLIKGNIILSYTLNEEKKILNVPVIVYVSEDEINFEQLDTTKENQTCVELGIQICEENESCSSSNRTICEGGSVGCIGGTCVEIDTNQNPTESKGKGWVAILIVLIIVGLLAFVILKKYKKIK